MSFQVHFADEKVKKKFEKLISSDNLYKWLNNAFNQLSENCRYGTEVHKKLIPKEYKQKYGLNNIWKIDLPESWRLIYTLGKEDDKTKCVVIDWMTHKEYERKFKY